MTSSLTVKNDSSRFLTKLSPYRDIIAIGGIGAALLVIGGLAALNQRLNFIPAGSLANRIVMGVAFTLGGFLTLTAVYSFAKNKLTSDNVKRDHVNHPSSNRNNLTASDYQTRAAQIRADYKSKKQTHPAAPKAYNREDRLVLDRQAVLDSMEKNLKYAKNSQDAEELTPPRLPFFSGVSDEIKNQGNNFNFIWNDGSIPRNIEVNDLRSIKGLQIGAACSEGQRKHMEDKHSIPRNAIDIPLKSGVIQGTLFGVFDGHSGKQVAEHLKQKLQNNFLQCVATISEQSDDELVIIYNALKAAIVKTGREAPSNTSGATVACGLIIGDQLFVANLGDCRVAVLPAQGHALALSDDAKVTKERFKRRVEQRGGTIVQERIDGCLNTMGACGNLAIVNATQKCSVPQRAQITRYTLGPKSQIIIGCDGLWDVARTRDVGNVVKHLTALGDTPDAIAMSLVARALKAGSSDNVTAMVIRVI